MIPQKILDKIWRLYFWREYGIIPGPIIDLLAKSQYWSRDKLIKYQINASNNLFKTAADGSTYYRHNFKHTNLILKDVSELDKIPYITKEIIRQNSQDIKTGCTDEKLFEHTTSGSTGDPLAITISAKAQAFRTAGRYRFYSWWGIRPYDRNILIWAQKVTGQSLQNGNLVKKVKKAIRSNTIDRTLFVDVFKMNPSTIKQYYANALDFRPVYIRGYLSGVIQFAELLREAGLEASNLKIKLIIVTSEVLHDEQRKLLEKAFNCPVANEYGSAEAGFFAFECPKGSLHVFEEAVLLSSLPDGRAVVTEYLNSSMPLINYINNDMIKMSGNLCSCGRTLKTIKEINGRVSDFALNTRGEKVSPYLFYYAVKELNDIGLPDCVKKYKVIQNNLDLQFFIIKGVGYTDKATEYLTERVKKVLGEEIKITFNFVDEIEREKSGKLRFFLQQTDKAFAGVSNLKCAVQA